MLLADYWKDVFPDCEARPSAIGGTDLINTGPFAPEAKARKSLNLLAWMRQARKNAGKKIPFLVVRMNGQGEKSIGEWFVVLRQDDFKTIAKGFLDS